jgi:hypothetical protein
MSQLKEGGEVPVRRSYSWQRKSLVDRSMITKVHTSEEKYWDMNSS